MVADCRFVLGRVDSEPVSFPAKHVCPTNVSSARGPQEAAAYG